MTERLRIPEELGGPYEHALIATYGVNLEFFEQDLWRSLGRARNRILLADDIMLARAVQGTASGPRLRHLNLNYVGAPVTNPRSFHAKLILLAGPDAGLLLVGSGNLGMSGYASQGELFCRYRYEPDSPDDLPAFQAVKELVDVIGARGYLDPLVRGHVEHLWADTTWIYGAPRTRERPVRHSLEMPLLEQLAQEVGGDPVNEMVVLAPFYDREAEALRRLVRRISPARITVLLQEHETSVEPASLEKVLEHRPHEVRTAAAQVHGTYLHAKLVLVRQRTRSVCLQGSANLSLAGLCLADPEGNIELVNLLTGPADAFDGVVEALVLGKEGVRPSDLFLTYRGGERDKPAPLRLVLGTWSGGVLILQASSPLPSPESLRLLVAGVEVGAEAIQIESDHVSIRPDPGAASMLDRAIPVALRVHQGQVTFDTNAIYPYHPEALRLLLAGRRDPELLHRAGSLAVPDDDIARLLDELEAALVVDGVSVWRLARRTPSAREEEEDGTSRRWDELDWEALRSHPKLAQYESFRRPDNRQEPTDLQVILNGISNHFHGLVGGPAQSQAAPPLDLVELDPDFPQEVEAQSEEERAAQEEDRARRRIAAEARNRLAWRRFIDRCLAGLTDNEFMEHVGPIVLITNLVIFNHLLSLLVSRRTVEASFGIQSQLRLWAFLWGAPQSPGILAKLDGEEQEFVLRLVREARADSMTLASLYRAAMATTDGAETEIRVALRDVLRRLLTSPVIEMTPDLLRTAANEAAPLADNPMVKLAAKLASLAHEFTSAELFSGLAAATGARADSLLFKRIGVKRRGRQHSTEMIVIQDEAARFPPTTARAALATWAHVEQGREYYRLDHPATRTVAVFDRAESTCWWADKASGKIEDLGELSPQPEAWERRVVALLELATAIEKRTA